MTGKAGAGLVFAHVLDGKGGAEEVGWERVRDWKPEDGLLWLHLDHADESARQWLAQDSGI